MTTTAITLAAQVAAAAQQSEEAFLALPSAPARDVNRVADLYATALIAAETYDLRNLQASLYKISRAEACHFLHVRPAWELHMECQGRFGIQFSG